MVFIGKMHEISMYGLIANFICLFSGKISVSSLVRSATQIYDISTFFHSYMFWATILFVPIAIMGAFATKYVDEGEGLLFKSDNIIVIIFAHIAEELLGLICTPFWFLKDLFTHDLDDTWKKVDYITYAIEILLILGCMFLIL